MRIAIILLLVTFTGSSAFANIYTCAKMVYSAGWLKKYDTLGETWGANTKKMGILSSVAHSSIEKTTSSVDPGVTTKTFVSTVQYTSSWGECSILDYQITMQMRKDYIEQNADEIKTQIAMGDGIHVDSLAFVSGCHDLNETAWKKSLKERAVKFYESKDATDFVNSLDEMIKSDKNFAGHCSLVG